MGSTFVTCEFHGLQATAFACVHLARGVGCGYVDDPGTPSRAWCAACELRREPAELGPMCGHCFAALRNEHTAHGVTALDAPATTQQLDEFFAACLAEIKARNRIVDERYGLSQPGVWHYDADAATLTIGEAHAPRMVCDVQLVGGFSHSMQTWLWAWAHGGVAAHQRRLTQRLHSFGDVRGIPTWTTATPVACDVGNAWGFTAGAAVLLNADAVYRMPGDDYDWFALLFDVRAPNPA